MTPLTLAGPLATPHTLIGEHLDPFCDPTLDRFTDHELLEAYDLAARWADELPTAETAMRSIAAEWHARYRRNVPRAALDFPSAPFAGLAAAQFDTADWDLDIAA